MNIHRVDLPVGYIWMIYWGMSKMAAILQKALSNELCQKKILVFWLKKKSQNSAFSIGSGDGLALNKWQVITWTNDDSVHICIIGPKQVTNGVCHWDGKNINYLQGCCYKYWRPYKANVIKKIHK